MKLRLRGLDDIDPLAIPLPHGTEVTTRVDRMVDGRRVRQGALGRVVAASDDRVDVRLLGVGVVSYARSELMPHKLGQVRYAARRDAAWTALAPCVVIDSVVGSRAWGLADEGSDVDRRGVYVLPFSWTTSLVEPPLDLVSEDGSSTYWEVGKALRQAVRADPNTLEMLFVTSAAAADPMGAWILEARDAVVSADIYGSFGRYALSQLKKLRQSLRLAKHRDAVVAWVRDDPTLDLDAVAARLADATELEAGSAADKTLRAKQYIKQLYGSLYDQGILAERNFAALVRMARGAGHEFELPRELRPKNAYNLVRLIATAITWLETGSPQFEIRGALRDRMLEIKSGSVPMAEVLAEAEAMTEQLETARGRARLPARADIGRVDRLLRRVRAEAARRHVEGAPGPWGRDAPELPEATWTRD